MGECGWRYTLGPRRGGLHPAASLRARKPGRLRDGPVVSSFGERDGVRKRAPLMGEGCRNGARRGHRAVHQGQRRPPRSKAGKNRHPPFGPASQGCLGARALLCRRGETARARPGGLGAAGGAPRAGEAGRLRNRLGSAPVTPVPFLGRESAPKLLLSPDLCASCASPPPALAPALQARV